MKNNDLMGKTMIVTGATAGIGLAAMTALAARGAYVIGVGRSAKKADAVRRQLLAELPQARIDFALADLSTQRSVRALAADLRGCVDSAGGKLDALINNAGTVSSWYLATEDNYELQFAVNHLAPFLLTYELMPQLRRAAGGRVVTVSSSSHYGARIRWNDVMHRRGYSTLHAYQQSKLANVLFSVEFNRRLTNSTAVRAYAADPGLVRTEIGLKGTSGIENWVWQRRMKGGASPEYGAQTAVHLASAELDPVDAVYWKDSLPQPPSAYAQNPDHAARLWELSERLCGISWGAPVLEEDQRTRGLVPHLIGRRISRLSA